MPLEISIDTHNAAAQTGSDLARMLRRIADTLDEYPESRPIVGARIYDDNGNSTGRWALNDDPTHAADWTKQRGSSPSS